MKTHKGLRPRSYAKCLEAIPLALGAFLTVSLSTIGAAVARPEAPGIFCDAYPNASQCSGRTMNCDTCHDSTYPASWNPFGRALLLELDGKLDFDEALLLAVESVQNEDSDGDGVNNREELELGTGPGDPNWVWVAPEAPEGPANPRYFVEKYDARFAYRRAMVLYCGHSPTYKQMQQIESKLDDERAAHEHIHETLDECLESDYWKKEALPRLADRRIRPLEAAGPDSRILIGSLRLVIGDYNYDYRLWRYVLTGDRDVRELLTAQYHVVEDAEGELTPVEGTLEQSDPTALAGGQPLEDEYRAGLITTQWFLSINTMFSGLPRTTAAQAYRAFLGADLSSNDGILPVQGEPVDVDDKGVAEPECATCHSTLDPLAYAFAKYEGIDAQLGGGYGGYRPERLQQLLPAWDEEEQRSVILGEKVDSLPEWAEVAANSDMFLRNLAAMFFEHALSKKPGAAEFREFTDLWQGIPDHDYSANQLIHRLVDMEAFGNP